MKRHFIFAIALLCATSFSAHAMSPPPAEWVACQQVSDCVNVEWVCGDIPANKDHQEEISAHYEELAKIALCMRSLSEPGPLACENNVCIHLPAEPSDQ